jgi:hypothetical protein|nr:MAG TPA: hypothetical protein [Bacteriophage sp.]
MTRCVIDSDGLFVEEQYFDDGRQSIEAEVPKLQENQAARWTGKSWEVLPDYRGAVVFSKDGEKVWKEIGSLPDGVSLTPLETANLADLKADLLTKLNAAAQNFVDAHSGASQVPDFELATWPIQSTEAQAWAANKSAATPILDGIAAARGLDKDKLKAAALKKSLAYSALSAIVAGQRQAIQDQIEAAKTKSALDKIKIEFKLPEAV